MHDSGYGGGQGGPPEGGMDKTQVQPVPPRANLLLRVTVALTVLGILITLFNVFDHTYVDWLWFSSIGFGQVFTTILVTRAALFFVGFAIAGLVLWWSYRAAFRNAWGPPVLPFSPRAAAWVSLSLVAGTVIVALAICLIFALVLAARWQTVLLFFNAVPFGMKDPQFGRDAGFYVFTMPLLHLAQGWLMGLIITTLLTSATLYAVVFSIRGVPPAITAPVRTHLAILAAALMLTIAATHYLDIYETVLSAGGVVTGATYADVTARVPALRLLTGIAMLAAVIMLFAVRAPSIRQSLRLIVAAFGLWAVVGILGGILWPTLVQRFVVDPSALERESPYIQRNIQWTRYGFGLDNVQVKAYNAQDNVLAQDIANNAETIDNIPLWDPAQVKAVYNQVQQFRPYYDFLNANVDRYNINGQYREVLVAARELIQYGLDPQAQNWVNRHLVYTHGYGVVMSTATGATPSGQPEFLLQDLPPTGALKVDQPGIYYGESYGKPIPAPGPTAAPPGAMTDDMAIVNTNEQEFDHPAGGASGQPVFVNGSTGAGGVRLSGFVRRALFSWYFADINLLLNQQITPRSQVLFRRNVQERIHAVAPFLLLDSTPYIVVSGGQLYWIQDAYTITDRLPYSQRQTMTTADGTPTSRPFNYIRNSVKVVLNAYNGAMQFYTIQPDGPDPLLAAYEKMFPGMFKPIADMPQDLRSHIRYPQDLFQVQATTYRDYHMTNPNEFFFKEDEWAVAQKVVGVGTNANKQSVAPYYAIMKLPGGTSQEFVDVLPFTPQGRQNLTAWMAARSDGSHYGQLVVYEFPQNRTFIGPEQVQARIDNDPSIAQQFTLWNQSGSTVIRGNLSVIPIGQSLLYAEPVYLQSSSLEFPQLERVILATQNNVVMEPDLGSAVQALLAAEGQPTTGPSQPSQGVPPAELRSLLDQLQKALESLNGNTQQITTILQELQQLAGAGQ